MQRNALPCPISSRLPVSASMDGETALTPISHRVAELLRPVRTTPRYSDHGYDGETEVWEACSVTSDDVSELRRQLALVEAAMMPADPGVLLSRVHVLLSQYRGQELPSQVEAGIAEDWLDDMGEFPIWIVVEACRRWRRDSKRYKFRPLPGDIRGLCLEVAGRLPIVRERLRRLLAAVPASTGNSSERSGIRQRITALANAKRMP